MKVIFSKGHLSKVVIIRVLPGCDIIEAVEDVCNRLDVRTGSISCCIGSLKKASFVVLVPLKNKIGAGYSEKNIIDGPLEFCSAQGMIGQEEDGKLFVHMHGLLSDKHGNIHGGHLIKGENPVLITCEMMINQVEGIRMSRTYDPEVDMKVLMPSAKGH